MTFRIGQKIVCVNDAATDAVGTQELSCGAIYVVRWAGMHGNRFFPVTYCVRLVGIVRHDPWALLNNHDCPFDASRFRPIVSRKTSIEIFTKMLTPQGVDA